MKLPSDESQNPRPETSLITAHNRQALQLLLTAVPLGATVLTKLSKLMAPSWPQV